MIGAMNDRGSCGWNMEQAGLVTVVLQKKNGRRNECTRAGPRHQGAALQHME
jgi:hypothetical protein